MKFSTLALIILSSFLFAKPIVFDPPIQLIDKKGASLDIAQVNTGEKVAIKNFDVKSVSLPQVTSEKQTLVLKLFGAMKTPLVINNHSTTDTLKFPVSSEIGKVTHYIVELERE